MRCALMWFVFLCEAVSAWAVNPNVRISQYAHVAWRVSDGAIPLVRGITQTTDGYIWLATTDGLMRFDGVKFALWKSDDGEALTKGFTSALLGASDGSLWIGSLTGLSHLKNGKLYTYARPDERAPIASITEDRAGTIWVARYGISKGSGPLCRASDEELACYGAKEGIPSKYALVLAQDSDGYFWFGSDALCRWRPGSAATCVDEVGRHGKTGMDVGDLAIDSSGRVWTAIDAVGPQFGVRYFSDGKWSSFSVSGFDGPSIRAGGLYIDRHNSLWVGSPNSGLYRINDGVADRFASSDGLSGNSAFSFYEDRENNLWVITDNGLDMFRDTPVVSYSVAQGLFATWISSILARRDGSIWIANHGAIDTLRNGKHSLLSPRGLSGDTLATLFEDHTQTVWVGLNQELLAYQNGRFIEIAWPDGSPLRQYSSLAVSEDTDGNIWTLCSGGHLLRIKGLKVVEDIQLGLGLSSAFFLDTDKNGGVWIASKDGTIARYHAGQLETHALTDGQEPLSIREMIIDTDGSVLISTERGLVRWSHGQRTSLGIRNGLPCESIFSTIRDDNGSLWLYAQCGLLQIVASQVSKWDEAPSSPIAARVFDAHDGAFPLLRGLQHASSKAPDGRLWFHNGVLVQVVDPKHLPRNEVMPSVVIEDLIADRKVLGVQPRMWIPALTRDLQIDYSALSFSVPQKVHFRYLLENHDTVWQEPGGRRQAFYTDLRPGTYRFHVIASNNDGVWNDDGATLNFNVAAAWYQTVWFRSAMLAALLLAVWGIYQLRLRRLAYQFNMRLEERVNERTRIARELHDTLLQNFQGLMLHFQTGIDLLPGRPAEARKTLEIAIDRADQAIGEGRDAVQGLRTSTVETNDLASAVRILGEELRAEGTNQNSALFEMEVEGTPRNLHPILRDEAYRITGEALRNAFRHARAQRIEVEILYGERWFRLRVRDDGKGIDPKLLSGDGLAGHYGLHGMRERAKIVGGELAVWSKLDSGTEVELSIPASTAYANSARHRSRLLEKLSRKGTYFKETDVKETKTKS